MITSFAELANKHCNRSVATRSRRFHMAGHDRPLMPNLENAKGDTADARIVVAFNSIIRKRITK